MDHLNLLKLSINSMEIFGYIALFCVGLVLGTLGGGGSILSVPILVYLFSIDTVMASAYSLFIVGTTSLVGTCIKFNSSLVNIRTGIQFGIPSLIAIFITRRWLVPLIPDLICQIGSFQLSKRSLILGIFAILMILASLALIKRKRDQESSGNKVPAPFLILAGLTTGVLTGLVGAGGGFLIIPALVYLAKLPFKTTVGTTLFIITINSFVGFVGDVFYQPINWNFLLLITSLAITGIIAGGRIVNLLPTQKLQKSFGWFILVMGTWILWREI